MISGVGGEPGERDAVSPAGGGALEGSQDALPLEARAVERAERAVVVRPREAPDTLEAQGVEDPIAHQPDAGDGRPAAARLAVPLQNAEMSPVDESTEHESAVAQRGIGNRER